MKAKQVEERHFSDFGGLRIKESGFRLGDTVVVRPFNGSKQEILLNRISYRFKKGDFYQYLGSKCEIRIPLVSQLFTEYELSLCSEIPGEDLGEGARYVLKSIGVNPFKLNGNYTFEAFLEYGDIVELEYTRLEIKAKKKSKTPSPLRLNSKIVESDLSVL